MLRLARRGKVRRRRGLTSRPVRILLVNRFLGGTQIPTGRMLRDVAERLAASGHEVVVLASAGRYEGAAAQVPDQRSKSRRDQETGGTESRRAADFDGRLRLKVVHVPRWMPRAAAWLWFTVQAWRRIPRMQWDVCVLMTDPPLLPLLAGRAGERGGKRRVAVWLMDLYPEALAASGRIGTSSALYRWFFAKRQQALGRSSLLICLGEAQKERLATKGPRDQETKRPKEQEGKNRATGTSLTERVQTAVVPPWDERPEIAVAGEGALQDIALYAGNLGEAHSFEAILAAAPHLPASWKIRFAVRGAKAAALRHAASGTRVEVTGYVAESETQALLSSARVHLITMAPGWEGIVVPSKLYGCVRTGRPVLFIGPETSDTAREIRRNGWGECLPSGTDGRAVAAAILELAARPTSASAMTDSAGVVAGLIAGLRD